MAEAAELQRKLLAAQSVDGGWGYRTGSSWTEPTAFALLALAAQEINGTPYERGCAWLKQKQRPDGGWPPRPSVEPSTCVTSLVLLALSEKDLGLGNYQRAIRWTVARIRPELATLERLISRIKGVPRSEEISGGSPWFPGTAAWIAPTIMSVLALSQEVRRNGAEQIKEHVDGA